MTSRPRNELPIRQWPGGQRVAVVFVLYVEEWGFGQGPNFRPDMVARQPDLVNESFRVYSIHAGTPRVGRLFNELNVPLSIALSASYSMHNPDDWGRLRALVPQAAVLGHGINNSSDQLPLNVGEMAQRAYVRRSLDAVERSTGVRPIGWSSPSVYSDADTFSATSAEGIRYTLDAMDSDHLSSVDTAHGPLLLIPYPTQTVDMGQYLGRNKQASDLEALWIDYVGELVREAELYPLSGATVVAIGLHPFVVGTPDGTAALRRVLQSLKQQHLVWLTDTDSVFGYALEAGRETTG